MRYFAFSLVLTICFIGCPNPPDPEPERDTRIYLELIDTWTTSTTLRVSVEDTTSSWGFTLNRDGLIVYESNVLGKDTTIIDGDLEPNREYSYRVYFSENGVIRDSSLALNLTTMDTTDHNFVWSIDTLGDNNISALLDVAIINKNNIWAVGEIETDSGRYNNAHWDGFKWVLERTFTSAMLHSISFISENDIWVSAGTPTHWNGLDWQLYHLWDLGVLDLDDGDVKYCWGTSSSNMYFVGSKGTIVHYNGSSFEKMETGTQITLLEIDGTDDGEHVIVTGYDYVGELSGQSIVLKLEDGQWNTLFQSDDYSGNIQEGDYGRFASMDVIGDTAYFATSATDLLKYNLKTEELQVMLKYRSPIFGRSDKYLKGTAPNDLFFLSIEKELIHYNGISYHTNNILNEAFSSGSGRFKPYGMRSQNGIVCIVGETQIGLRGIIVTGIKY